MAENEIRVGDIGTKFQVTVKDGASVVDISSATSTKQIILKKPDGTTLTKSATFSSDGTDGLGRQLYDSPGLMKAVWGEEYWAGFGWFAFDMIYFWGGILFFVYVVWRDK